jgi:IS30 family transposase
MTKPKPKHLHKKMGRPKGYPAANKFQWTDENRKVVARAYAIGLSYAKCASLVGCEETTLERELKRDPDFRALIESASSKAEHRAKGSAFERAFPSDPKAKGDTSLAIFLLKTRYGMRENADAKEIVAALAPLIQFQMKETHAPTATPTAGTYFDPPKETEES